MRSPAHKKGDKMHMTKCFGKGNMKIFIDTSYNYASIAVYSYSTLIMWCEFKNGVQTFDVFNKKRYSSTTTRHQGYAADIYVQLNASKNPVSFLSNFGIKDLRYMDIEERKHWNLI